jgi:endogenous inhibitor of DNA gyrase (YacG/DUF329 family)
MINATCPVCGRRMQGPEITAWPRFPFCSTRCKTIDQGRWLSESYGIRKSPESILDADEAPEDQESS